MNPTDATSSHSPPNSSSDPRHTPLHEAHVEAGATMADFAGYAMPIRYESIVAEHHRTRKTASLFDVSHMARLRFEGPGAGELLDHLLSRPVSDLPPGGVRYALVLNAEGGVKDDVLVTHVATPSGTHYFLVVVNASNHQKILRWVEPHLNDFPKVQLTDRTELTAMIAVQGPAAIGACAKLFTADVSKLKYYRAAVSEQFRKPVIISRTGYTGEDGLELIVRAEDARRVWENILMAGRDADFAPAGLGARDTLRMEAAMPLYGHELDESIDPLTAGLSFACRHEQRHFIGDESIRRIAANGPDRRRIGLVIHGRRPARQGAVVHAVDGTAIGVVTSGGPSPTLDQNIAMALVDANAVDQKPASANAGGGNTGGGVTDDAQRFIVKVRGRDLEASATKMPFYCRNQ